jgi:uncharacterized protein (TIGR02452 family)
MNGVTKEKLMGDIREKNIKVFEDTLYKINQNDYLKENTFLSIKNQKLILENEAVEYDAKKYPAPCKIYVTTNRTMEAAYDYVGKKTAVLNFASATTPGGGVRKGSSAQEEALCRVSNLYLCLTEPSLWEPFYQKNRDAKNNIHTDDIIYTPEVFVIKDDDYNDYDETDWFRVDVITCAAPNLREVPANSFNKDEGEPIMLSDDELYKVHYKRAIKIMEVACANNVEVLILGAFGCGAFRNNPTVVAKAYKDAVKHFRHAFKEIEFAVYCPPKDPTNYNEFKKAFN